MRHDRSKIIEAKGGGCSVRISRLLLLRRDKTRRKYKKEMVFAVKAGTKILTHLFHARTRFSRHVCPPISKAMRRKGGTRNSERAARVSPGCHRPQIDLVHFSQENNPARDQVKNWFIFEKPRIKLETKLETQFIITRNLWHSTHFNHGARRGQGNVTVLVMRRMISMLHAL